MQHQIKYSTIEENLISISVEENNNVIDLRNLGEILQLRLPKSILRSRKEIKILAYFKIWFKNSESYFEFFQNNSKIPTKFLTNAPKTAMYYKYPESDHIIQKDNALFYSLSDKDNKDNAVKKIGHINECFYDLEKHCVSIDFSVSKEIMGSYLHFDSQEDLIEKLACSIRNNQHRYLKAFFPFLENKNLKDENDNSLAFVAAWNGNEEALNFLYNNGLKIEDNISIAGARHLNILKFLDKKGLLKASTRDENGFNPLQQACNISSGMFSNIDEEEVNKRLSCIDFLLSKNANIDFVNHFGRTALMTAAQCNNYTLIQHLISKNANTDIVCKDGKKAIDYSSSMANSFILSINQKNYNELYDLGMIIKQYYISESIKKSDKLKLDNIKNNLSLILDFNNYRNKSIPIEKDFFKAEYDIFKYLHKEIDDQFIFEIYQIVEHFEKHKNLDNFNFDNYKNYVDKFNFILDKKVNKAKLTNLHSLELIK